MLLCSSRVLDSRIRHAYCCINCQRAAVDSEESASRDVLLANGTIGVTWCVIHHTTAQHLDVAACCMVDASYKQLQLCCFRCSVAVHALTMASSVALQ